MQILDYFFLCTNIITGEKKKKKGKKSSPQKQNPFLLICLLIDFHVIQELAMQSLS